MILTVTFQVWKTIEVSDNDDGDEGGERAYELAQELEALGYSTSLEDIA